MRAQGDRCHGRVQAPRASSGTRDAGRGTVFCCAMDPPTKRHRREWPGLTPVQLRPSVILNATDRQLSVNRHLTCSFMDHRRSEPPFRTAPAGQKPLPRRIVADPDCCGPGFQRSRVRREPGRFACVARERGLRSAELPRSTVPGRPALSAGTVDQYRCRGPAAVGCVRVDLCSRTAPARRQPGP